MAAPNFIKTTSMYGKTAVMQVGTSASAIIDNAAGSSKVLKVNCLMIGNVDTVSSYKLTVDIYNGSFASRIVSSLSIPANSGIDVLARHVYLEEGQSLRLTSDTASKLEAIASYEEVA